MIAPIRPGEKFYGYWKAWAGGGWKALAACRGFLCVGRMGSKGAAMDPGLLSSLFNAGGLVALAAVLLYLHLMSLKTFREELKEERDTCERRHRELVQGSEQN